jgi:hypothetical protein
MTPQRLHFLIAVAVISRVHRNVKRIRHMHVQAGPLEKEKSSNLNGRNPTALAAGSASMRNLAVQYRTV